MSNQKTKTNVNTVSEIGGKKNIKKLHEELGFGELSSEYKAGASTLDIDQALKKELEENGLVCRFINFGQYKQKGFHPSRWVPYKRETAVSGGAVYTLDANGYTVKQDLVLAVKPKDWNEAHKKYLKDKADRLSGSDKEAANKLRESMKDTGYAHKVYEGFEDN